jgi:hypothetical protein
MIICLGPVCIPLHLLLPFLLGREWGGRLNPGLLDRVHMSSPTRQGSTRATTRRAHPGHQ